ncbi:MAG: hypothetical protein GTO02_09405 [Candidatus Dadabacteria bacterium]|nr:hypothetical protein [Candidatus Dadabacteria bacterium]
MQNPKGIALKKFMVQAMGDKANPYDDLITRLGTSIVTDTDLKIFGEMVNDLLSIGYNKAVDDYRQQLNKLGIEVSLIVPQR